ncbi:PhzF family phenazine biosynthesis protein [Vagococcus fessus]|uniref:Uncharacterized protein n=1 Tax=Vagococcus fessus TaxID=120370 RepID=A0A430ABQ6_9ENTE|nr:PhzF family phenazine biosynthesis protein [Vagococcus fessus]RSU04667.1 hypothetical protein CBF31_01215 [Vagococcus fessus]
MEVTVYVASAFSKNQKGGNKAGIVLMEQPLNTNQKMEIARQLGYAETAFISTSETSDYFRIRLNTKSIIKAHTI